MQNKTAIILGHSHLSSVVNHLVDRPSDDNGNDPTIEYHVFDTVRLGADFCFTVSDGQGSFILNPLIREMVSKRFPDRNLIWISMFGGNAHNALTLLEHPRPFDFILPEKEDLPVTPSAEIVPTSYIEKFLYQMAERYLLDKACLRQAVTEDVLHIESPPPNGDDSYVMEHLEGYFRDQSKNPRVAPRMLRYKLWRLHSEMIRNFCAASNIQFIEAPPEGYDAEGFLVPSAYSGDSTHAGPWYGGKILRQIESHYNLRYGGWNWLY